MTALDLTTSHAPSHHKRPSRVRWDAVGIVVAIVIALAGFWRDDTQAFDKEAKAMGDRVTVLETNRINDASRMERIESKIDRLLEREAKR